MEHGGHELYALSAKVMCRHDDHQPHSKAANPIGAKLISRVPYCSFLPALYDSGPSRSVTLDLLRILAGDALGLEPNATSMVLYVIKGSGKVTQGVTQFGFDKGGFSSLCPAVIETSTDLVIRIGSLSDSSLKSKRLGSHHRLLCAAPAMISCLSHLQQPSGLSSVECLAMGPNERWHFRPSGSGPQAASSARQVVAVSGKLCTSDLQALHVSVLGGAGIALLPAWLVGDDIASGNLIHILPGWDFSWTTCNVTSTACSMFS